MADARDYVAVLFEAGKVPKEHAHNPLISLARAVGFATKDVEPAAQLYIAVEDRLRVLCFNSVTGVEVDIIYRLQLPDGQIIPCRQALFPTSNRAVNTFDFDMAEGFLLDVSVASPSSAVRVGACFVVVQIIRGAGANAVTSRTLLANYINSGNSIGWPEGPSQQSIQGAGLMRSVVVGAPAAGADWLVTIPTGARWLIQSVMAQLVTSAAVANRQPILQLKDGGGNLLFDSVPNAAQAASLTGQYMWAGGVQTTAAATFNITAIPDVASYLQGFTIGTLTSGIQAADQWSNVILSVVEWIEQ